MIRTALYQVGKNWAVGARDKSMLLAQEAQQVLAKTSERVSKPKFTFGPKSPAALSKVSATEALSRQNKTFHFGTSKVSKMSFGTPKCDTEYIKHLNAKFLILQWHAKISLALQGCSFIHLLQKI